MKYHKKVKGIKKPVRTISGVTPLTVVLKPRKCDHGGCIYCPGNNRVPQSYTDKSPAIMRAMALGFDPYKQVKARLRAFKIMNHPTDKIELIFIGGTFLQYSEKYQKSFVKACFDALNGKKTKTLEQSKKLNEKSKHRCVAFCIENRPDNCSKEEIQKLLNFGVTRVEIGVQHPDNRIYKKVNRGHTVEDVISATRRLKDAGFKVGFHIMPGLPGSNLRKDLRMFRKLFRNPNFKPDQLKIYPCQIIEGSPLSKIYKEIGYRSYNSKEISWLLKKVMKVIPRYCRVMRVMREIPKDKMLTEPIKLDLRKDVEEDLRKSKKRIKEIRMREVGFNKKNINYELERKILKYNASGGKEFFIEIVNKEDILFALLRLRIFGNRAIVRELHVYGKALEIGHHKKGISQHSGLGKSLMQKAEEITRNYGISKLKVISGVGVREYYKKLGYNLEGTYMVKNLG